MKVFVVEDDEFYGRMLKHQIELDPECKAELFHTGKEMLDRLAQKPALIPLDYSLPDISCEELLSKIQEFDRDIPVVIVTAQENISTAIELLKKGAYEYI